MLVYICTCKQEMVKCKFFFFFFCQTYLKFDHIRKDFYQKGYFFIWYDCSGAVHSSLISCSVSGWFQIQNNWRLDKKPSDIIVNQREGKLFVERGNLIRLENLCFMRQSSNFDLRLIQFGLNLHLFYIICNLSWFNLPWPTVEDYRKDKHITYIEILAQFKP